MIESKAILPGLLVNGLWDWPDVGDDLQYWSPEFKALLGYEDNEIEASYPKFRELLHPDDVGEIAHALSEHFNYNVPFSIDYRLKTKSGKYRWFHADGELSNEDAKAPLRMTCHIVDIHERKESEVALQGFYAITSDNKFNLNNKIQKVFKIASEYLGLKHGFVISPALNNTELFLQTYNVKRKSKSIGFLFEQATQVGGLSVNLDVGSSAIGKMLRQTDVKSYITVPVVSSGGVQGALAFYDNAARVIPFTESQKLFLQLVSQWVAYELGRMLQLQQLKQVECQLTQSIERLTRSNASLEQFAFAVSHDLREPLAVVQGYTELLNAQYANQLDDKAIEYIDCVSDSTQRMQLMIADLLDYAKASNTPVPQQRLSVAEILAEVVGNLNDSIRESAAEILVPSKLPEVVCNKACLTSVLQNLVVNAVKYQMEGRQPQVIIEVVEQETEWLFSVSDNGVGISADSLEDIFKPFKRLWHEDERPGTGIGLSICKKTVEDWGGRIWAVSNLGCGSQFYFTLPMQDGMQ